MLEDNVAYTDPPPETISPELTTSVVLRIASCNPLITSSPAVPSTPPTRIVATLDDVPPSIVISSSTLSVDDFLRQFISLAKPISVLSKW